MKKQLGKIRFGSSGNHRFVALCAAFVVSAVVLSVILKQGDYRSVLNEYGQNLQTKVEHRTEVVNLLMAQRDHR